MTQLELEDKVVVTWKGYGSYKVTIEYRHKFYTTIVHESLWWDTLKGAKCGYTKKQALQGFYDACKRDNNLR